MSKYLKIEQTGVSSTGRTKIFTILLHSRFDKDAPLAGIGTITWYGGWRKYVANLTEGFYDWEALRMIADFCETETKEQATLGKEQKWAF